MGVTLGSLISGIDSVVGVEPERLADPDSIVELHRQVARLEAVEARAVAAFDAGRVWEAERARTAAAWLSVRCRLAKSVAKREVRLGRSLRHLPVCERAWLAGELTADHVNVLASVRRPETEERLADDEELLVGYGKAMSFAGFVRVVRYWAQHADPDGEDDGAADDRAARKFHFTQSIGGMWFSDGVFDPLSGAAVATELRRLEDRLFEADWAQAKARLGREPTVDDLARTAPQRRADALLEMAIRSASAPAGGRRPEPLFTVLVGWETLQGRICQLANGTVVAPGALLPWLDTAWLERVVFDGPSRVIDVGAAQRLFKGATRRAVEVRDQECFHEFCDTPADQCQVDHITPYMAGGPTIQSNGRMACGAHNRARHKRPDPDPDP